MELTFKVITTVIDANSSDDTTYREDVSTYNVEVTHYYDRGNYEQPPTDEYHYEVDGAVSERIQELLIDAAEKYMESHEYEEGEVDYDN